MRIKQIAGTFLLLLVSLQLSRGQLLNNGPRQATTSLSQIGDSLTIDQQLQQLGERLLQNKQGSIVAIEPATGKILALVNVNRIDDGVNRAIAMDYSPGSTFKVAQAITMLSEKALVPEKTYPCRKGFWYDKIHIGCHPHKAPLALEQAIAQSCNSYFCKAFQEFIDNRKLYPTRHRTIQRWHDYMSSMGLGQPLGVDIPGEAGGVLPDSASLRNHFKGNWNGTSIMWVGMGQGEVTTTPLQLCNLAAVIANRGHYITPHIHAGTPHNPLDAKYTTRHKSLGTPEAYDIVIRGMHAAVVNGTCASINTKDYKICGKTGTAENHGKDHSIFMGFAPMEKPRIAVSVYIENGGFGADLAAPIASLLIEQYINGKLSKASALHADRWSSKAVKVTPVEKKVSFDDL